MATNKCKLQIINEDYKGLHVYSGSPDVKLVGTVCNQTRAINVSQDGRYIAYSNNQEIKVVNLNDLSSQFYQDLPGVQLLQISPKNTYLQVWTLHKTPEDHNLIIYDIKNGSTVKTMKQKQSQWNLHWTDDESLCVRYFNEELQFYEKNNFDRYAAKFHTQKVADLSLTTNKKSGVHYFAVLSLGSHGQPNFVRLYRYPQMETAIANKSFFRTDRATFKWRPRGDAVLILCAADVDKTGKSYYGEQNLNYMDVNGKACAVKLNKDGPIHAVEWHPSPTESLFCVSYGFVPPRVAFLDSDCRIFHDFGEMHVNQIHFNPFGNLVIFAGFGNLRGGLNVYNTEKKTLLSQLQSPDTTVISWAPDGAHLLTSVTSPRMRVGNCWRLWHYSGKQIHEEKYPDGDSLFRTIWQPDKLSFPNPPKITETGIKAHQIQKAAEPARYVPPHLRKSGDGSGGQVKSSGDAKQPTQANKSKKPVASSTSSENDKEKKIKAIEKKLDAIKKLKKQKESGGQLEKNQLAKLAKEKELTAELKKLQLSD